MDDQKFFVTVYNPKTDKHSISRIVAPDADAAKQRAERDFEAIGAAVIIETVEPA